VTPRRIVQLAALAYLLSLLAVSLVSDWFSTHSAASAAVLQSELGQAGAWDVCAWWTLATRNVLAVSATATLIGALLGAAIGGLAIYGGHGLAGVLSRLAGFTGAFPGLLLVGLFRLGDPSHGVLALLCALSLLRTLEVAQLVRGEVLSAMLGDFVEASRALGASRRWQLRLHVLPRLTRPFLANLLRGASALIGLEAALSFVGLGLPAGVPSWGGGLAVVARSGSSAPLLIAALSIGLTSGALYGLGMSLRPAPPAIRNRAVGQEGGPAARGSWRSPEAELKEKA